MKAAGEQVYRLVTTLLDPFAYPAKEVVVLYHERWHVEVVIDETRTHLRLSAPTLRSLTPEGVIYALLLAHLAVRTLMLQAAEQAQIVPTQISFTETIRIIDESLIPFGFCTTQAVHGWAIDQRNRPATFAQTTLAYSGSPRQTGAFSRCSQETRAFACSSFAT